MGEMTRVIDSDLVTCQRAASAPCAIQGTSQEKNQEVGAHFLYHYLTADVDTSSPPLSSSFFRKEDQVTESLTSPQVLTFYSSDWYVCVVVYLD